MGKSGHWRSRGSQFDQHQARLGPLEWLIASPAFHHWHHTALAPLDRNYASVLPWMDRIFGTYFLPRNQWPTAYGIEATLPALATDLPTTSAFTNDRR